MWIDSEEALRALYGPAGEASLAKEVPALTPQYRALVEASPFCVLATSGPGGGSMPRRAAIRRASSAFSTTRRC